jgi:putative Mg2+ transporter-C (MgtC) family protein
MPLWEIALRLSLAVLLGSILGIEREARLRPAGARDHALVALGAALFTVAGIVGFGGSGDTSRLAAGVVTGIGFIGAGAILRTGLSVRGITTAATLWMAAALGVALGSGLYAAGTIAVGLGLAALIVLQAVSRRLQRAHRRFVRVDYERGAGTLGPIVRELEGVSTTPVRIRISDEEDHRTAILEVTTSDTPALEGILASILHRPEVRDASVHRHDADDR